MPETRYVANTVVVHRPTGRVLVMTRAADDTYRPSLPDLPGGKVDPGETMHEGAARELFEEAGIRLEPESLTLVFAQTSFPEVGRHIGMNSIDLLFVAFVASEHVVLSEEHSAYEWVDEAAVAGKLGHEPHLLAWAHIQSHGLVAALASASTARQRIFAGAKLLLENDKQETLVLRRSNTHPTMPHAPDFPGGYIEFGELPEQAILRELDEETGLTVLPESLRLLCAATVADKGLIGNEHASATYLLYGASVAGSPAPKLSYEHDAYWWRKTTDLPQSLPNHNWQQAITYVTTHHLIGV